jgi:hypothetical protein
MKAGIAAMLGLFLWSLPAPAEAAKHRGCAEPGSETQAADARARVFYSPRKDAYFGCLRRTGRRREIPYQGVDDIYITALTSPFVVYDAPNEGSAAYVVDVYRFDLRTGRDRKVTSFGEFAGQGSRLHELLLTRAGTVVWARERFGSEQDGRLVEKFGDGRESTLDPGPTVDAGSLALSISGRRVYWTNAGEPRSARLR